ncbi:POU domain class 6 transcription factor 1 [Dissostichus eleginoides]|uniref:POU domain protein n=1 Tax=Dissostichus eleginoides TaxID=100907 RepID=A0AAD9F9Z9_DISEL|nr:POU domain class 6 transcription factor 1 [Dissostichus eleginoides]
MNSQDPPAKDAPLTVNEQVIVMSGNETIRVLEVEVDASLPSSLPEDTSEVKFEVGERPEAGGTQEGPQNPGGVGLVSVEVSAPAVQTMPPAVSLSLSHPQANMPITVQSCPQVLTQESLASLLTGMMAQTGSLGQPMLIPLSMAGSIGGGGLAVLTLPSTNVASLPGYTTANTAGNLLKLPFAGLQAATVLNSLQPQLQTSAQTMFQPQVQVTSPSPVPQVSAAQTSSSSQSNISLAALQNAGLSINPAIISAASLGAQPQFLSSLTSTPIITSNMSNMAGITSQLITNAQGQLVLNSQGQIIATLGNGCALTSAAVLPKVAATPTFTKPISQASVTTVSQSPIVIAPQPSLMKTPLPPAVNISCGDMAKVGQLIGSTGEEGINLDEIREFAKNFKIRRLSLGLTQTQVGQALTATEGPAYSQSAICRFEKLDITPKSAQKLKPVLEKWLAEAEHWNQKGQQNLMEFVGGEPSKKRKRRTSFTPQAIEVLNSYFDKNALPTGQEITEMARELNYDREVVRVWFCNRRQTLKNTSKINVFQVQ